MYENLSKEKATLIWCTKEAIYKWYQKGNIDFIKDIKLHNFEIAEKGVLTAEFKTERLFLNYQKINNDALAQFLQIKANHIYCNKMLLNFL